ncbi:MAG TPA: ABC transporter permease, partial [Blastocatellia bacterium]|nr:ABC transporter permease [Blastocatellia bacterium]
MKFLGHDLKYGFRLLIRNPAFSIIAITTLGLGIGANTAIFSVVDAALFKGIPYPESDRLVMLWSTAVGQGVPIEGSAIPDYREWREQNTSFTDIGGFYYSDFNLSGESEPERVQGARVTGSFFPVLGVSPLLGRGFTPEEERWGNNRVVLLSYGLWERRYGKDRNIVGRDIRVGGASYTVVGVMPEGMAFLDNTPRVELFTPISFPPDDSMATRNNHFVPLVARLKPGVSVEQAQSDVSAIARRIEEQYPTNKGMGGLVVPLREQLAGDVRSGLLILLGAVAFVLLVACANVANLLLARSAARERELAIRSSLGAGRRRLIGQLLVESAPLAAVGGLAGLALAWWASDALAGLLPQSVPRYNAIRLDARVFAFTVGLSLLTVIVFGLLPAFQVAKSDVREMLNDGGRLATAGRKRTRMRNILVAFEMALAVVLLAGAGLMLRSLAKLNEVAKGFESRNVLTCRVALPASKYPKEEAAITFIDQLVDRINSLPGAEAASAGSVLPLGAGIGWGKNFSVEGHPQPASLDQVPSVGFALVGADYFRALGINVRRGRVFDRRDTANSQPVAIINETLARRFFPNEEALGKTVWMGAPETLLPPDQQTPENRSVRRTVVGIVDDVKGFSLSRPAQPMAYAPLYQYDREGWSNVLMVAVRTSVPPRNLIPSIREQVRSLDSELPVAQISTMDELVGRSLSEPRFNTILLLAFAGLGLLLASVGVFGVISYLVTQRTHEIGIRLALGAGRYDVLRLILGRGVTVAGIGVAAGLGVAMGVTRVLSGLLYE